jgi:hypothetical protein
MPTTESAVLSFDALRSTDRRSHDRAPLSVPALIDNLKSWLPARCNDVSMGGIAIECDAIFPLGEVVELYFELPNGVPIETLAEVVRCDGKRVALRFVELSARAALGLRSHCRQAQAQHH